MNKYANYMQKYAKICSTFCSKEICKNMQKYAKICMLYAKTCKICNHDFYMQNMQKYALPTLLMEAGKVRVHRGAASVEPGRTVRTGPNLNSTQNGDPKDTYLQCEGRNKHDEVQCIPKRFCKSLLKSRNMTVCIWHKSVCTLPRKVRTRFEQTRFGLHLVCKCCEAMFRCCKIICELGAFLFA